MDESAGRVPPIRVGTRVITLLMVFLALISPGLVVLETSGQGPMSTASLAESVTIEPGKTSLRPGQTASFTVTGTSQSAEPILEIQVPMDLQVVGQPACTASALVYPFGSGPERSRSDSLSCGTDSVPQIDQNRTVITGNSSPTNQQLVSYTLVVTFTVRAPSSAIPGMVYAITAPVAVPIGGTERALIVILDTSGSHVTPLRTPTPAPTPLPRVTPAPTPAFPPTVPSATRQETTERTIRAVDDTLFQPSQLSASPGQTLSLELVPELDTSGGVVNIRLVLPPQIALVKDPVCTALNPYICAGGAGRTDHPDGTTELHWWLMYGANDHVRIGLLIRLDEATVPGTPLYVVAHRSYPTSPRIPVPEERIELEINVKGS